MCRMRWLDRVPATSLEIELDRRTTDGYRQLLFGLPYEAPPTLVHDVKQTLADMDFRSARGYADYARFRQDCLEVLRTVSELYRSPLVVIHDYLRDQGFEIRASAWDDRQG